MKTSTSGRRHGIKWTTRMQLENLNFADDRALLSNTQQPQDATTVCINQITLDVEALEDVKSFIYLGSIMDEHSGSDADLKARICKARAAYLQLKNIWNSKQMSVNQHQGQNFQYKCQDSSTV
ncbi:unnamed protein product [Schistosoma margrebowiei]|uniref:Uncharacterized protein n=1 Tax=Schistosoma margrebowiei TaxID=48269 RepID=A0A183MJW8_9TREM|nr:unnamed protein product [Schistosoma margrebowiei]